jgi:hypothetical protein
MIRIINFLCKTTIEATILFVSFYGALFLFEAI